MKKAPSNIFTLAKIYRTRTKGPQGATYFRRLDREMVSKTGDFIKETLGGLP